MIRVSTSPFRARAPRCAICRSRRDRGAARRAARPGDASIAARGAGQVDDWAHVIVEYNRLRVILHASSVAAAPTPRFTVHGRDASWIKNGVDAQEYPEFYRPVWAAIDGAGSNPVAPEQAVAVAAAIEAAIRSSVEGRAFTVPLTETERLAFSR